MVKIAVAGGTGQVAREVIDALVAAKKHEITILSRSASSEEITTPGIRWLVVNYSDKGVNRFAPSEYASAGTVHMPWWAGKEEIRKYLRKVNENRKVLEYTLFQPGLFLDYLASPYKTARHVAPLDTVFDFQNRRAIIVDGHEDAIMTLTTAADLAAVVARAVDYEGEWPEIGGISGNRVTFSRVIEIGEKIRGGPFTIDKVKLQDLEAGVLKTSWALTKKHGAIAEEQASGFFTAVPIGMLLSSVEGAWDVSDELNQLFADYKFEEIDAFLTKVWDGKP
ncbi:NAD(P)-binding protein [Pleurostoma richardsiae]|uniref:NAD(P)-binding protein n=1 Tax=Pleurostoma richardsiae TaxID=41990 RepID=A0AA38RHP4_9PEZI|nr:NAD(P)-binding protein [Pleurostoma richardsiae]